MSPLCGFTSTPGTGKTLRTIIMRMLRCTLALAGLLAVPACTPGPRQPQPPPPAALRSSGVELPGRKADGSVLLPNQWSLRPAGRQIALEDFPINIAVHPGGRFAAVLHSGYSEHQILVVDIPSTNVVSRTPVHVAFYGLEFSRDGKTLFCSGAGDEVVHAFDFKDGTLSERAEIRLHTTKERAVPAGLTVDGAGNNLFVANLWADRITRVDLLRSNVSDILLGTNPIPTSIAPIPASWEAHAELTLTSRPRPNAKRHRFIRRVRTTPFPMPAGSTRSASGSTPASGHRRRSPSLT